MDALSDALGRIDPNTLKRQLSRHVPSDAQQILAAAGVRDEHVLPTPIILEAKPTLVVYYRPLLGVSQKAFFGTNRTKISFRLVGSYSTLSCAMKFMDGMGGNPHWFYQGASEPLGLSRAGHSVPVSSMPLKGTGEARGKPRRGRAWLRSRTVSSHEVGFNLRGTSPLSQELA
jgi:XcyI restriction endonuclease